MTTTINLDSFKKRRPHQKNYIDRLEHFIAASFDPSVDPKIGDNLPLLTRLVRNFNFGPAHLPAQLAERIDKKDFGTALGNYLGILDQYPCDAEYAYELTNANTPNFDINEVYDSVGLDGPGRYFTFAAEKWFASGEVVVETTKELGQMFSKTNTEKSIKSIPASLLRSSLPEFYYDMTNLPSLPKLTDASGNQMLIEGALVIEREVDLQSKDGEMINRYYSQQVRFDQAKQNGIIKVGKTIFQDIFFIGSSFIDAETQELKRAISVTALSYAFDSQTDTSVYDICQAYCQNTDFQDDDIPIDSMMEPLNEVFNAMFYMSLGDEYREVCKPRLEIKKQIAATLKDKKKRRLEKTLQNTHDYIRIGNQYKTEGRRGNTGSTASKEPHLRIGYWRSQRFGPKLVKKKIIWIKPKRINAEKVTHKNIKLQ
ncbi:hypothetical protein [Vibrio barjaei]|uniref:hypothetical protein n=1 Tax=Vibrio barjaei TaxID=1676683 RepID=UPI0022848BE6|nr:hypothetical protein [Vibrio barjaei]MCY9872993.1 hypothetical protein [Vibrio barjaei]